MPSLCEIDMKRPSAYGLAQKGKRGFPEDADNWEARNKEAVCVRCRNCMLGDAPPGAAGQPDAQCRASCTKGSLEDYAAR